MTCLCVHDVFMKLIQTKTPISNGLKSKFGRASSSCGAFRHASISAHRATKKLRVGGNQSCEGQQSISLVTWLQCGWNVAVCQWRKQSKLISNSHTLSKRVRCSRHCCPVGRAPDEVDRPGPNVSQTVSKRSVPSPRNRGRTLLHPPLVFGIRTVFMDYRWYDASIIPP